MVSSYECSNFRLGIFHKDILSVTSSGPSELLVTYDLQDPDNVDIEVGLRVSDSGETYDINTAYATGDVGFPVKFP